MKAVRSRTGAGTQNPGITIGHGTDESCSKPIAGGACAPSLNPSRVLGRRHEDMPSLPTGPGKSRRPG